MNKLYAMALPLVLPLFLVVTGMTLTSAVLTPAPVLAYWGQGSGWNAGWNHEGNWNNWGGGGGNGYQQWSGYNNYDHHSESYCIGYNDAQQNQQSSTQGQSVNIYGNNNEVTQGASSGQGNGG